MEHEKRTPGDLPAVWRERAERLREWGCDEDAARIWNLAATDLEQILRSAGEETLDLQEASRASGYSADHLGQLVRDGTIPNAGRRNAPRIRREDLPIKNGAPEPLPGRDRAEVLKLARKLR